MKFQSGFSIFFLFVLVLGCTVWDLSSPTRDQTPVTCIARHILNLWTTREVPILHFMKGEKRLFFFNQENIPLISPFLQFFFKTCFLAEVFWSTYLWLLEDELQSLKSKFEVDIYFIILMSSTQEHGMIYFFRNLVSVLQYDYIIYFI